MLREARGRAAAGAPGSLARAGAVDEARGILDEQRFALAQLRARVGEPVRAAREMTAIARTAKEKPALQMAAWREAARFYASAQEIGNAQRCWAELEHVFLAIGPKGREKLPRRPSRPPAEAHFALGASGSTASAGSRSAAADATLNRRFPCYRA